MRRIRAVMGHMRTRFMNLGVIKRMILGYILIVVLPVSGLGYVLYNQLYESALDSYAQNKQVTLGQIRGNLEVQLAQVEALHQLLQYNSSLIDLLNGQFHTEMEQVYEFKNNIERVFSYIVTANDFVDSVKVYKFDSSTLTLGKVIQNLDATEGQSELPLHMHPGEGSWKLENGADGDAMTFYKLLYNDDFSKAVGLMEVKLSGGILFQLFGSLEQVHESNIYFIYGTDRQVLYEKEYFPLPLEQKNRILGNLHHDMSYFYDSEFAEGHLVNLTFIEELDLQVVILSDINKVFGNGGNTRSLFMLSIAVLLLVLSLFYYFVSSSILKRIIRLARHMRKTDEKDLLVYTDEGYTDEIGVLSSSYNMMVQRINDLVHTVYRAEMRQKEAAFLALQAQINPHFLYNSLESIRMMAEMKGDDDTADMCCTLGELLRYSLARSNRTTLDEEIANIKNYIKIQKIRLGDRLLYEMDIQTDISQFPCPKFILQPLVENCIVHGISKKRSGGTLHISITEADGYMNITISDNGTGIGHERLQRLQRLLEDASDAEQAVQTAETSAAVAGDKEGEIGIGIVNVNERLKAYYGDDNSRIHLVSKQGEGTAYNIRLKK